MAAVDTQNPAPLAPGAVVQHSGPLMQLSGKGLLAPGSWKRRHCVLDQRRLYFYQLKEENQGHYRDKTSHYIDLECYDICEETKSIKTASNVVVISSSHIEKSFFETGRLYLSADTAAEMNQWISQIRMVMTSLRDGGSSDATDAMKTASPAALDRSIMSIVGSSEHLDCITKQRAKGPTGRRLPRQAKTRLYPATVADNIQQQQRSESLPKLEQQQQQPNNDAVIRKNQLIFTSHGKHNRSFEQQSHKMAATATAAAAATVYAYSSSSDESLHLSSSIHHRSTTQDDVSTHHDDETVETLCEVIHHQWTSTPSLAVQPQQTVNHHWQSVGSSRSTPRPVGGGKRRSSQPYSCGGGGGSTSTDLDDPTNLSHQFQLLLQQTATMRTTLSSLEANVGASRRDMGWLQENLTTVQNATGSVSDKVVKMQSQVVNMERQINATVKEAQQLQQRANDALKSASDAERDFRRLESECQSMLNQLRREQQQTAADDPLETLSPMTPHPPYHAMDDDDHHQHFSSRRSLRFPSCQLDVPPTFDFASLLLAKSNGGQGDAATSQSRMPKSSFRTEGVNKNGKSISFGPTTTYATSPTTDPDDVIPFATSTLRKTAAAPTSVTFLPTPLATIK